MKLFLPGLLAFTLSLTLTSCDSSDANSTDGFLEGTAVPTTSLNVGDRIDFTPITSDSPTGIFVNSLTFDSNFTARESENTVEFTYQIEDDSGYSLTGVFDTTGFLQSALEATLSQDSPIAGQLRNLLLRDEDDFTEAELIEIATLLNPAGANLAVDVDGDSSELRSVGTQFYFANIDTTELDRLNGFVAGDYQIQISGFEIAFRQGIPNEFDQITVFHRIPFVTGISFFEESAETGRYLLQLGNNGPNF